MEKLPYGFLASGRNVGIKNSKRDAGVLISEVPCTFSACVTTNRSRAACTARIDRLKREGAKVRALLAVSGNANALTGAEGARDDEDIAAQLAEHLGVPPGEVLTACTGVVGHRLPRQRIVDAMAPILADLSEDPSAFAEAILTTDRIPKVVAREVFVAGTRCRIHAVAKGSSSSATNARPSTSAGAPPTTNTPRA